jgi:hypothetical protein
LQPVGRGDVEQPEAGYVVGQGRCSLGDLECHAATEGDGVSLLGTSFLGRPESRAVEGGRPALCW